MFGLPVFIILLLLVSPAATVLVDSELQRDLAQQSPKDFGMRTDDIRSIKERICCSTNWCC
uniref:Conotoxin n=1 Tax=Conus andremenezi TaxID=1077466 RepID=A0A291C271_9COND|nr:conotoxin [Conus andremenezi]